MTEPELHLGDDGEWVVQLQVRLYGLGILREIPDQVFGSTTETAVRELQTMQGQSPTGEMTTDTWALLQYAESQIGIHYSYMSPYDALDQIVYDLQHGVHRDGSGNAIAPDEYAGELSPDGQYRWDGVAWQAAGDYVAPGGDGYAGHVSDDGQYRWDGTDWRPVAEEAYAANDGYADHVSDDGQYRWDGLAWQPVEGGGHEGGGAAHDWAGHVSDDGQWRWDGNQWQVA